MSDQLYRSYNDFSERAIYPVTNEPVTESTPWNGWYNEYTGMDDSTPISDENLNAMLNMLIYIRNVIGKTGDFDTKINSGTDNVSQPDDTDIDKSIATYLKEAFASIIGESSSAFNAEYPTLKSIVNNINVKRDPTKEEEGYYILCFGHHTPITPDPDEPTPDPKPDPDPTPDPEPDPDIPDEPDTPVEPNDPANEILEALETNPIKYNDAGFDKLDSNPQSNESTGYWKEDSNTVILQHYEVLESNQLYEIEIPQSILDNYTITVQQYDAIITNTWISSTYKLTPVEGKDNTYILKSGSSYRPSVIEIRFKISKKETI